MSDKQWVFDNPQEAADLIEQLQQRVGKLEEENKALAVHVGLIKHERDVVELADNQTDFNRSVGRLCGTIDQSPQTSLAEMRAKQAEESFIFTWDCAWLNFLDKHEPAKTSSDINALAKEHANKIRNGKGGK